MAEPWSGFQRFPAKKSQRTRLEPMNDTEEHIDLQLSNENKVFEGSSEKLLIERSDIFNFPPL